MIKIALSRKIQKDLLNFVKSTRKPELVQVYMYYLAQQNTIQPVVFPIEKLIFQSEEQAVVLLESQGKLWKETEIKVRFGEKEVNTDTQKIYICPFSGKVFGDNTNPNPLDAIYDWVANCPENTEQSGGLKAKRFFVSDDPQMIKNYISNKRKTITKVVFSSAINGKLFNSKQTVIKDFKTNYLKPISLVDVQNQNKFDIEENFLAYLQMQLEENKVAKFVEQMAEVDAFIPYVEKWIRSEEE